MWAFRERVCARAFFFEDNGAGSAWDFSCGGREAWGNRFFVESHSFGCREERGSKVARVRTRAGAGARTGATRGLRVYAPPSGRRWLDSANAGFSPMRRKRTAQGRGAKRQDALAWLASDV